MAIVRMKLSRAQRAAGMDLRDVMRTELPVHPRDEALDHCEGCGRALYTGDMAFSYSDGPTFCWEHSPTWDDLKRDQDELIADGIFEECFDGAEAASRARQNVLDRIADGDGDKHVASPL